MKILHITDSHGTAKSPEGRKDIYYIAFLRKLYELGYVIKKAGIDVVMHTGDLFHSSRVSDKFAGQVASMIKSWGVPVYVVPGNHDIEGYTIDTIDNTKLGLLAKAGVVKILDRDNSVLLNCSSDNGDFTVRLAGQEYYADIDTGNKDDFMMQEDLADFNVLGYHGTLVNRKLHPSMRFTMASDVITDADVILCGHLHEKYWFNINDDTSAYNPGAMMRLDRSEYNKTHLPTYGILTVTMNQNDELESEYNFYEFKTARPASEVLDYETHDFNKAKVITLDSFKESLQASASSIQTETNVADMIKSTGAGDKEVMDAAMDYYNNAFNSMPQEFEVKSGYIESPVVKYITKVEIKNFQSHEDTTVEFDNGLNVIVGESNNGKTSILRAIIWAVDNYPLGTDFIMAGKKDCSVKVTYSDGSYIKRSRSAKGTSSGTYECGYIDEKGNLVENSYSGFTNAVPVEIDNVHQMPKVSITKDIETHLNVMSQLEGPFLITDSPQNRSSAIGRLTGVHIADIAINLANTKARNDNQVIKLSTDEINRIDTELDELPTIEMLDELERLTTLIDKHITKVSQEASTIKTAIETVNDCNQKIGFEKNALAQYAPFRNMDDTMRKVNIGIKDIERLCRSVNAINNNINMITLKNEQLDIYKPFTGLEGIIGYASNSISFISTVDSWLAGVENANITIANKKQNHDVMNEYATVTKSVMQKYAVVTMDCKTILEYINKHGGIVTRLESVVTQKQNIDGEIDAYKQQIPMINDNMNAEILKSGKCPCCMQKITDKSVDHVRQYLIAK